MSESMPPSQEPQNQQGSVPQAHLPQGGQPPQQNFQPAPQQPAMMAGLANKIKANPAAGVYEIAMGVVQALIGLTLVFTGNQLMAFFGGGGYGSSNGNGAGIILLLVGLALLVAGVARPFKMR